MSNRNSVFFLAVLCLGIAPNPIFAQTASSYFVGTWCLTGSESAPSTSDEVDCDSPGGLSWDQEMICNAISEVVEGIMESRFTFYGNGAFRLRNDDFQSFGNWSYSNGQLTAQSDGFELHSQIVSTNPDQFLAVDEDGAEHTFSRCQ